MSDSASFVGELTEVYSALLALTARVERLRERAQTFDFEIVSEPTASETTVGSHSDPVREEAAKETGRFFQRCLSGLPRGDSGRSRVRLQNRIYVVIKTYCGSLHKDPVLVFERYNQVKALVCHPSSDSFGDSIFCGFPSLWEAKLAVATAGLSWP